MTKLEDKFWDAAINEAATRRRPPDQADQILMRLQIPDLGAPKTETRGRVFKLRRVLEVAAAAAALIAIGILTGLIPLGGDPPENGTGPDAEPRMIAAAPGAVYETKDNHVELKDGWLLVTTGAPDVHCEGSTLSRVDGRILVHAGSMPTGAQAESVADWLHANGLEQEMITQAKRWVQGVGLAALVLSGSALLDGNHIEAQDNEPTEVAKWYAVDSVMDIEKLPKEATHVFGWELDGAHLEFLSEHSQLSHLEYGRARNMRAEYLSKLAKLSKLEFLDLSQARWEGGADYSALLTFGALKSLSIDFRPDVGSGETKRDLTEEVLRTLSERGVELTLTGLERVQGQQLAWIGSNLKGVKSLDLRNNDRIGDADLRTLQRIGNLSHLDLRDCEDIGELGLAYVSKIASLRELLITADMTEAVTYQLAHMDQLEFLSVQFVSEPERTKSGLRTLARLPKLVRFSVMAPADLDAAPEIKNFVNLERLELDWWTGRGGFTQDCRILRVYGATGVRSMKLHIDGFELRDLDDVSLSLDRSELTEIEETDALREVTLYIRVDSEFENAVDRPIFLLKLAKFTGLKQVHVKYEVKQGQSTDAFIEYMKKVLKDYEVDFAVDE